MAINRDLHSLLAQFSGKIGNQLLLKRYARGIVLSKIPDMSQRKLSPKQLQANELMQEATFFAKDIIDNPTLKAAVAKKLRIPPGRVYHTLIKEYISSAGEPEIMKWLEKIKVPSK